MTRTLIIDHAADRGGGQLGLLRYLQHERDVAADVLFYSDGPVADAIRVMDGRRVDVTSSRDFRIVDAARFGIDIAKRLRRERYDVVVANSLYAGMALSIASKLVRRKQVPVLVYYSRVSMDSLRGVKRLVSVKGLFRRFDAFIANSQWTADCIPESLKGPRYVAYPVSGIEEETAVSESGQPILSAPVMRIISLSRLDRWKGVDLLVDAVARVADAGFGDRIALDLYGGSIYSDGSYEEEVRELAKRSPAPVTFHGHTNDPLGALRKADVFVLPTRQPEPFGQVVVQALAQRRLVVVPRSGGPLESVAPGVTGLSFEMGDAESLAEQLIWILNNRERAQSIAAAGRVSVERFFDAQTAPQLTDAIGRAALLGVRGRNGKGPR